MKILLSGSLLLMSLAAFAQTTPTTNPTGVGFGAGTPGTTVTSPVDTSSPGALPGSFGTSPATTNPDVSTDPRGSEFPRQEMQDSQTPSFPDTTPSAPTNQNTFPGATNPAGSGVAPGPVGSPSVGP